MWQSKSLFMRVNTEKIIILLNRSINQMKVIVYLSHQHRFLGDFKEFQDKISLQGETVCNSFSSNHVQTLLTGSSRWTERRQQLKLCKAEDDSAVKKSGVRSQHQPRVWVGPSAALPCAQRALTYSIQRGGCWKTWHFQQDSAGPASSLPRGGAARTTSSSPQLPAASHKLPRSRERIFQWSPPQEYVTSH